MIVIHTCIAIFLIIKRSQECYLIKKGFIIHKTGIIFKDETRIKLANVQAITYNQTFRGKILDYGNIEIIHEGEHNPKTVLGGISNPEQFIYFLEQNE